MFNIAGIAIPSRCILAPLAGISDLPFRLLNRSFGCEFSFIEMINARSLGYNGRKTRHMLTSCDKDRPLGLQLLACEEKWLLRALDIVKEYDFDLLDFNAACPAKKVIRRGEGAGLMKQPRKLHKLLKLMVANSRLPVTVKIRSGWDSESLNAAEVARLAEDAGVKAVFVHGRTRLQGYSGNVDYDSIRAVKRAVSLPVVASGDVLSAGLAKKMFNETGCDGLLVARGALGNPWIFRQIKESLEGKEDVFVPGHDEVARVMLAHLDACVDFYGERNGVILYRKFFAWYTKGLRHIREIRQEVTRVKRRDEVRGLIYKSFNFKEPAADA